MVQIVKTFNSVCLAFLLGAAYPTAVSAQDLAAEVAELRALIVAMRDDHEQRITELEARLERAERVALGAKRDADEAFEIAEQAAIGQSAGASAANTFNPAVGAVLVGRLADIGEGWEEIPGFQPGGEIGPGGSGFALGEAEINFKAAVDASFFGNLTLAVESEGGETEIGLEEAWVQTTSLPWGTTLTAGRFFSEAGYLNKFHRHADDFVDRPLPYQAFFGGQYIADGLRARWVLPTKLLVEVGAELDWGGGFPATANEESSPGAVTLFTNVGGDVGASNSWQLGMSWLSADVRGRQSEAGGDFSGDSDLATLDFVWKWAPGGNPNLRNFKAQAEYFRRSEDGSFAGLDYDGDQTGWYLQGIWQFAQRWRVGFRHDTVDADNGPTLAGTELEDPGRSSERDTVMVDFSPSEYSRLRMQYARDRVFGGTDSQWFLQYIMSVGAHGAHEF
jgi:hypothetical protein